MKKIYMLVGEASGDLHASNLVKHLHTLVPGCQFFGTGGDKMQAHGVKIKFHIRDLAVLGFSEIFPKLWFLLKVFRQVKREIKQCQPDLVILVDYSGFNLRLARHLHENTSIPVLYYIPPAVWARKAERVEKLKLYCQALIGIFPFEPAFYKERGAVIDYYGNPIAYQAQKYVRDKPAFLQKYGLKPDSTLVVLMPGSRESAFTKLFPILQQTAKELAALDSTISFIWCLSGGLPSICKGAVEKEAKARGQKVAIESAQEVLAHSDFAFCGGSTATLEALLLGCPCLLFYQLNALTYKTLHKHYKLPYYSLPNIILKDTFIAEVTQSELRPEKLVQLFTQYMQDQDYKRQYDAKIERLKALLFTEADPYLLAAQRIKELFF